MTRRPFALLLALVAVASLAVACGKKGPPLPPLVQLPAAPGDVSAVRRGGQVDLSFRVPKVNIDGSTPASLDRIDVYAFTAPGPVDAGEVVRRGARVGTVLVNPPADDDDDAKKKKPVRTGGVDRDQMASVSDPLPAGTTGSGYRAYVIVGVSTRGRRGALAPRINVPLVPLPPTPAEPVLTYDEKAVTLTWTPLAGEGIGYSVRVPDQPAPITASAIDEARFSDTPIVWGKEKCYEVRSVTTVEGVRLESEPSPRVCVTPKDTFPPAAPEGLIGVGSEGSISLIWTANNEADLAGYIVLRAEAPSSDLRPVTQAPIADTNFRDTVPAGARMTYAVVAVDRDGNRSQPSAAVTETAR